jgi:hypothetical protein
MTSKTITEAIARSISHNEIVRVSLDDLLTADERAQMNEACNEWDVQAYNGHRRDVVSAKMCEVQDTNTYCDSVENGDVVEMWGTTADGDDYCVHIAV